LRGQVRSKTRPYLQHCQQESHGIPEGEKGSPLWTGRATRLTPSNWWSDHQEELKDYHNITSRVKLHEAITRLCVKLTNELTKKLALHNQKAEAVHG
jgi:hypothetical protein